MTDLLRAELIKLSTTRTFAALAGIAVATSLLLAGLTASIDEPTKESVLVDVFASDTSSIFVLILAIIGISGEWRHRTITSSLLAAPDRVRFLAAKTLSFAVAGTLLSLLIAFAVAALAFAILSARDLPTPEAGELLTQIGRGALVSAMLGALGVGVGALVRNQAIAVAGVLVLTFAVEPLLFALAPDVGRFGPFSALSTAAAGFSAEDLGIGDVSVPRARRRRPRPLGLDRPALHRRRDPAQAPGPHVTQIPPAALLRVRCRRGQTGGEVFSRSFGQLVD